MPAHEVVVHVHARGQLALAFHFQKPKVVELALETREVAMSEIHGHFPLERDRVVNIELAARPRDEVRGLVADHGQELDEEVGGRGAAAVYCAGHGAGGVGVSTAAPESLSRVAQCRRCGARAI